MTVETTRKRRDYQKPRVSSESVFERQILGTGGKCTQQGPTPVDPKCWTGLNPP